MKKGIVITLILVISLGFLGCNDDNFDNSGPSTLDIKIEALNKSFSLPVKSSTLKSVPGGSTSVEWDSAHLMISYVKFEAELKSLITRRDSIEISYKWSGPQLADLFNPDLTFGNFMLQPGFYDEIEISLKGEKRDAKEAGVPVFYMSGMYTGSTAILPVEVRVHEDITFKTERDSVEVTEENLEIISYIQLYLDELMEEINPDDLDNAKLTKGVIVISSESNHKIYYTLMKNIIKKHHCYYDYKHKKKKKDKHDDD